MKVRHAVPAGWVDTAEAGVIQPSEVSGLAHEIELEEGDLMQGPQGEVGPQGVPGLRGEPGPNVAGMVAFFACVNAPSGWLVCDGSAKSRADYAALFEAVGVTFGAGDGVSTFSLPNLLGEFVRGWDGGRGVDVGRVFGSGQTDALQNVTGDVGTIMCGAGGTAGNGVLRRVQTTSGTASGNADRYYSTVSIDFSRQARTSAETRPRNVALLPCIATGL